MLYLTIFPKIIFHKDKKMTLMVSLYTYENLFFLVMAVRPQ